MKESVNTENMNEKLRFAKKTTITMRQREGQGLKKQNEEKAEE